MAHPRESGGRGEEPKVDNPLAGLDMAPTIAWYQENAEELLARIPEIPGGVSPFRIEDPEYFHINEAQIAGIASLFPENALSRSRLNTGAIIGKPSLYFHRDSIKEDIKPTSDVAEAFSPTAIVPSYTDYSRWRETGIPSSDVVLYRLPEVVPPAIRPIIHAQGLAHEIGHTFVSKAIYTDGYRLQMPDGAEVEAYPYLIGFAAQAEAHPPMSHYSSFYRKTGEEFTTPTAIEEELVESIAARLLGFAFNEDPQRRMDPFVDRPEIAYIIDSFLNAQEVA